MAQEEVTSTAGVLASPAVIGYCLRGTSDQEESFLYFVLRDDGLFLTCGHSPPHEVEFP